VIPSTWCRILTNPDRSYPRSSKSCGDDYQLQFCIPVPHPFQRNCIGSGNSAVRGRWWWPDEIPCCRWSKAGLVPLPEVSFQASSTLQALTFQSNEVHNFVAIFKSDEKVDHEDWQTSVDSSALLSRYADFHPSALAVFVRNWRHLWALACIGVYRAGSPPHWSIIFINDYWRLHIYLDSLKESKRNQTMASTLPSPNPNVAQRKTHPNRRCSTSHASSSRTRRRPSHRRRRSPRHLPHLLHSLRSRIPPANFYLDPPHTSQRNANLQ